MLEKSTMPRLSFKGKVFVENHHLAVPFHELLPERDKGLNERASLHDNLIVHGDNLAALKSLLPTYHSKVKCIYIDPPYNTGKEGWAYSDKVNSPFMQDWLGHVVDRDDLTRHDKWLCMMLPRLKLLCELLREDGVIFVSIDDNEVHHLRCLMAEVFGEENFIACLPTVMNRKGNNDEFGFSGTHEYTLCWAKDISQAEIGEFPLDDEELEDWKEDEFGYWKQGANLKATGINAPRNKRPNLFFPVFVDENDNLFISETNHRDLPGYISVFPVSGNDEMSWRWSKEKFRQDAHDVIISRLGNSISLYKKQRPKAGDLPSRKPKSLLEEPAYSSGNGTAMMKSIFGEKVFDYPKPTKLIMDLLSLATNEDSIVLDSFAGSGTTAQAVLALNRGGGEQAVYFN